MKYGLLLLITFAMISRGYTQLKSGGTNMPEGTTLTKNDIKVLPGYIAFVSDKDNNIVHIQRADKYRTARGTSITGSFTCMCSDAQNYKCGLLVDKGLVACIRLSCEKCTIQVVLKPSQGLALTTATKGVRWNKIVFKE
jgi:hypothetical protein